MTDDDLTIVLCSLVSATNSLIDAIALVEAKGSMRPDERRQQLAEKTYAARDELLEATVLIVRNSNGSAADSQPSH